MPRHDQRFKDLLRAFFPAFLPLAVPEPARRLDLGRLRFLDKELFTDWPEGRRRELDLLAEVSLRAPGRGAILVHVEIERPAAPGAAARLHRSFGQLRARHDLPILSILVYLRGGPPGVSLASLPYTVLGEARGRFDYTVFGLSGCAAETYLAPPEPLAWALAALMRLGRLRR